MGGRVPFKIHKKLGLEGSSLIVGWNEDAGKLGPRVIDYLNSKLASKEFAEIEPADFFSLSGVTVEDDVAQFSESKFYVCQEKNLVVFNSSPPRYEVYRFLNSIMDVAEKYCNVKEVYTIGSMISLSAHTLPRELLTISNSPEMKGIMSEYGLAGDVDYETPSGQRPTVNSYLLWIARKRNVAGAGLWVPVPFYLVASEDPSSWRKMVEFFNLRLQLGIDLREMDDAAERQNMKIEELRIQSPEVDSYIQKLEKNYGLSQEESEKLVSEVEAFLSKSN